MSLVVILLMAVTTVVLGSLWSGYAKQSLRMKKEQKRKEPREDDEEATVQAQDSNNQEEELSVHVSPIWIIFFVCCMCSMLVLLYFFFAQLVYLIMGMFCLASSLAMYSCLEPLVMATYTIPWLPVVRLPKMNLYLCILHLELRCTQHINRFPLHLYLFIQIHLLSFVRIHFIFLLVFIFLDFSTCSTVFPVGHQAPLPQAAIPSDRQLRHCCHLALLPQGGLVMDHPGPPWHHVQYQHAQGAPSAQPQDLHLPPLRPLLLRHLLRVHHPPVHGGRQECDGGGGHRSQQ